MEASVRSSRPVRAKPLAALLASAEGASVRGDAGVEITGVTYRSGEAAPGSLFFCVPGGHVDGHDFAADAARRGAVALVVERWIDVPATQVLVPVVRRAIGPMSSDFYDNPSSRMTTVGVTGTNGKTTTTYLLESIFRAAGLRTGVIGTTGVRIDGRSIVFDRTTPEGPDLQRLLHGMADEDVGGVAMEVSSHGLDQYRVDGTRFRSVVFTNLTQDHLDYHGTMEAYFRAKARLFTPAFGPGPALINADTPEGRRMAEVADVEVRTFGLGEGSDFRAGDVRVTPSGVWFRLIGGPDEMTIRSSLRGAFSVSNCLGAAASAICLSIPGDRIAEGIAALRGVPGRLEPVEAGQPFPVLVDYAHTPDSLQNVLRAMRQLVTGRVIVVFGCGGDRDRGKRPLMGEEASRLADLVLLTSDNPRSEEPLDIIAEIEVGARRGGGTYAIEADRRSAIRLALGEADPGDVVLIAGKGHETGQQLRDRTIPFDDRTVAREEIESLFGGGAG